MVRMFLMERLDLSKHYMLRKTAIYCIRCLIQSLKVVMIWQKDNPDQTTPEGKSDLCFTICHFNTTFVALCYVCTNRLNTVRITPKGTVRLVFTLFTQA